MADINAVNALYPKLFAAVLADDWKASLILAADLKAAHEAPQQIKAYTHHYQGNAS